MNPTNRNTLVISAAVIGLLVLLGGLRFMLYMVRLEQNRPPKPIKELPSIYGQWEDNEGTVIVRRQEREIEGKRSYYAFEKDTGGQKETSVGVVLTSSLDLPGGDKGVMILHILDGEKVSSREKIRWRVHFDTLQLWDEKGRERVLARK